MKFDDIEAGRIHGHVIKSDRRGGEQEIRRPILDPLPHLRPPPPPLSPLFFFLLLPDF